MATWIENLKGRNVIISGGFGDSLGLTQEGVRDKLRSLGAIIQSDVTQSTQILLRGWSPLWKYGDFGDREAELAVNQRAGRDVSVIDVEGFRQLMKRKGAWGFDPQGVAPKVWPVGRSYVEATTPKRREEEAVVFARDPAEFERALIGHVDTQNALARFVRQLGFEPLSPAASPAQFDVAWVTNAGEIWVAEVKSVTKVNESIQLRLGLGQVLEYAWRLSVHHSRPVRAVVIPERRPMDSAWIDVVKSAGVVLTWPNEFESLGRVLDEG